MVQTSEHKRLLIIKSLHTNNNDYYKYYFNFDEKEEN